MPRTANPVQLILTAKIKEERDAKRIVPYLSVSEQKGKPRVKYRTPEHSKPETATLQLKWNADNIAAIIDQLAQASLLLEQGHRLSDAVNSLQLVSANEEGIYNWSKVYELWAEKQGFSIQTRKKYDGWYARMHQLLRNSDFPVSNGKQLFRQYERLYLADVKHGTDGRSRPLGFFSNLIDYAVANYGLSEVWVVPKSFRLEIIGKKEAGSKAITPPVQTPDLMRLLNNLEPNPDVYTMVGLMAFYGLMGSELAVIRMTDEGLETFQERKFHTLPKNRDPRKLEAIDPLGREGWGESIAEAWQ